MGVFYRKYRPKKFDDVVGHDAVKTLLSKAISTGQISHAYLFSGPRGVGKTTLARLIALSLNCKNRKGADPCGKCSSCEQILSGSFPDVIEIDAASNRGIDEIRDLRDKVSFPPMQGTYKVYIIDEAHMLTREAFNALLKTLEEPPKFVVFILCTTEPNKLPETIISRCQWFELHLAEVSQLIEKLKQIAKREKAKVDDDVYQLIARVARGSFRDSESLFESLVGMVEEGKPVTVKVARRILNIPSQVLVGGLFASILEGNNRVAIKRLEKIKKRGFGAERVIDELIGRGREELLGSIGSEKGSRISEVLETFVEAKRNITLLPDPFIGIELAISELSLKGQEKDLGGDMPPGEGGYLKKLSKKLSGKNSKKKGKKLNEVVLALADSNRQLASIIEKNGAESVSDDEVVLRVSNGFEEGLMSKPEIVTLLRQKFGEIYGNAVKLRCKVVKPADPKVMSVEVEDLEGIFDADIN